MASTGQCKVDPVTGVSGDIWNALIADGDNGLAPNTLLTGSINRKLVAAKIQAIAASILAQSGVGTFTAWPVVPKAANFNAATWNHYRIDTTAGNVTVTLPAAAGVVGQDLYLKKISADANAVQITGTVDGNAAYSFNTQWQTLRLRSNGVSWDLV